MNVPKNVSKSKSIGTILVLFTLLFTAMTAVVLTRNASAAVLSRTYTFDADFDEAYVMVGVEHESVHDQLQLIEYEDPYQFMWIANSGEDSVSKFDTNTGMELARYNTWFGALANHESWEGPAPSRTSVDQDGNCYVINRQFDTSIQSNVIKIWAEDWKDRNGNGVLDTSYDGKDSSPIDGWIQPEEMVSPMVDSNGDGIIQDGEIVDERIAWIVTIGDPDGLARSIAIDLDGNVWVGFYNQQVYYKLSSVDGSIIGGPYDVSGGSPSKHTPYGALVDKYGILWGASKQTTLLRLDTNNPTDITVYYHPSKGNDYGIAVGYDALGNTRVYQGSPTGFTYIEFNSATETFSTPAAVRFKSLGIATDSNGDILTSNSVTGDVYKFNPVDGSVIWSTPCQLSIEYPLLDPEARGTIVDNTDNLWVIHRGANKMAHYNSGGSPIAPTTVDTGHRPYAYSDAAGSGLRTRIEGYGLWRVIWDTEYDLTPWCEVSWSSYVPTGTSITVEVRSSNDNIAWSDWETATTNPAVLTTTPDGRYVEVKVEFTIIEGQESPIFYDLTIVSCEDFEPQCLKPILKATATVICEPLAECKGKVTELTLQYLGSSTAFIEVEQKKDGESVFADNVDPNEMFTFTGEDDKGTLGTEIILYVNDIEYTRIHTSCSKDIGPGLICGDFKVIAGESMEGGPLSPVCANCQSCDPGTRSRGASSPYPGDNDRDISGAIFNHGGVDDDDEVDDAGVISDGALKGGSSNDDVYTYVLLTYTVSDQDSDVIIVTVDWGDGTSDQITHQNDPMGVDITEVLFHPYEEPIPKYITITAVDDVYCGEIVVTVPIESDCPPPEPPCGECKGRVTGLTLKYLGDIETDDSGNIVIGPTIKVTQKKDNSVVFFEGYPQHDGTFTFADINTFGTEISIYVDGVLNTRIHTSCSKPIGPGLICGDFEVIEGTSLEGGILPAVYSTDCSACSEGSGGGGGGGESSIVTYLVDHPFDSGRRIEFSDAKDDGGDSDKLVKGETDTFDIKVSNAKKDVKVKTVDEKGKGKWHKLKLKEGETKKDKGFIIKIVSIDEDTDTYTISVYGEKNKKALSLVIFDFGKKAIIEGPPDGSRAPITRTW